MDQEMGGRPEPINQLQCSLWIGGEYVPSYLDYVVGHRVDRGGPTKVAQLVSKARVDRFAAVYESRNGR